MTTTFIDSNRAAKLKQKHFSCTIYLFAAKDARKLNKLSYDI